jgi:hypothetical protein
MFKMAFRLVYRIKGRCSRHPAYNPVKDEQGGIKGGCEECQSLLGAYRAYLALRESIEEFHSVVQRFITNKQALSSGGGIPSVSAPELSLTSPRRRSRVSGNADAQEAHSESSKRRKYAV